MFDLHQKEYHISDWIFTLSIFLGIFYSPALLGIILAVVIRNNREELVWHWGLTLIMISSIWGLGVMVSRPVAGNIEIILQYGYVWLYPLIVIAYNPEKSTLKIFSNIAVLLFVVDSIFNIYSFYTGADLFGRVIDLRETIAGNRYGGVFAHSFYSASISIGLIVVLLFRRSSLLWMFFPLLNIIACGSSRFIISFFIVVIFHIWRNRNFIAELVAIIVISCIIVLYTMSTSEFNVNLNSSEINASNTFRVIAWNNSLERISNNLVIGFDYPRERELQSVVTEKTLYDSLVSESWYLRNALSFGVPYVLLRFLGIFALFYYLRNTIFILTLFPMIIIDLTYGNLFEGTYFYSLIWPYLVYLLKHQAQGNNYD